MEDEKQSSEKNEEQATSSRGQGGPYSTHHPVPTIQHYRQVRQERDRLDEGVDEAHDSGGKREGIKNLFKSKSGANEGDTGAQGWADQGYNRNQAAINDEGQHHNGYDNNDDGKADNARPEEAQRESQGAGEEYNEEQHESEDDDQPVDTSEAIANETDPRKKRKAMKGRNPEKDKGSRKITDPVTHLPATIHDFTTKELNDAPANLPISGSQPSTATGINAASKDERELKSEEDKIEEGSVGMQKLFPPPSFDSMKGEIGGIYLTAFTVCSTAIGIIAFLTLGAAYTIAGGKGQSSRTLHVIATSIILGGIATSAAALWICKGWLGSKINTIWQDSVWEAARAQERKEQRKLQIPESAMWLNSIVASIWPLINPDLFASMVDTLEDVMQASLPKVVRMIAIDDFGQGKSALRILGVRWLPTGAAGQSVSKDGKVKSKAKGKSDREDPDKGTVETDNDGEEEQDGKDSKDKESGESQMAGGLEAEAGDFVNMELSFSYRATAKGKSLKKRNENAHMYLVFYLPASTFKSHRPLLFC